MSHPNPSHAPENSHKEDYVGTFSRGMKNIRSGLQKAVGHKRRERHLSAKNKALVGAKA